MRTLVIVVLLLLTSPCHAADEQTKLKRLILSDCNSAKGSFEMLDPLSRESLAPYLSRVLELQPNVIQSLRAPLSDANIGLSLSVTEPKTLELSIPVDPNEGIEAKRCALELLGKVGKVAFTALPKIVELSLKPTIPNQLKRYAAMQARDIAVLYARDLQGLSEADNKTAQALVGYLGSSSNFIVHSLFIELGVHALPIIVEHIPRALNDEMDEISLLLRDIQTSGVAVAPYLYPLLSSGEEALQVSVINLLVSLQPPLHEVLLPLIKLLDDISPSVREAARTALKNLTAKNDTSPFPLENTAQDSLITTFRIAPPKEREQMIDWLAALTEKVKGLEEKLINLYQGAPTELKSDILACISVMRSPSSASFSLVQGALKEKDFVLRANAIKALGRFPASEAATLKQLATVFQTLPPLKDSSEREHLQFAAAEAIALLDPKAAGENVIQPLIKMLEMRSGVEREDEPYTFPSERSSAAIRSRFSAHPAVRALVAIGESARKSVEKTARPGNSDKARRAIAILGQLPVQQSSITILTSLLSTKHLGTKTEATRALLALGPTIIPHLRKQSAALSGDAAIAVSEVTILLGEKTLADSKKIYRSLLNTDCPNRIQRVLLIGDFSDKERIELAESLVSCLGLNHAIDQQTIAALIRIAPLEAAQITKLVETLRSPAISPQLRIALLDHAKELGIQSEIIFPLFAQLLKDSPDTVQVRLIRSIGKFGAVNEELTSQLKGLISDDDSTRTRSYAAAATLAKTNPGTFDFSEWLKDELEREPLEPLKKTLRSFPNEFAESLLLKILPEVDDKKKQLVLSLLSSSIKSHEKAPDAVISLLSSNDTSIKFEAFRVAYTCCSAAPVNEEALRDLLYSNESKRIASSSLPPEIRRSLEQISQNSPYLSERTIAKRLLSSAHS